LFGDPEDRDDLVAVHRDLSDVEFDDGFALTGRAVAQVGQREGLSCLPQI
jgi:hypothetical protein